MIESRKRMQLEIFSLERKEVSCEFYGEEEGSSFIIIFYTSSYHQMKHANEVNFRLNSSENTYILIRMYT